MTLGGKVIGEKCPNCRQSSLREFGVQEIATTLQRWASYFHPMGMIQAAKTFVDEIRNEKVKHLPGAQRAYKCTNCDNYVLLCPCCNSNFAIGPQIPTPVADSFVCSVCLSRVVFRKHGAT